LVAAPALSQPQTASPSDRQAAAEHRRQRVEAANALLQVRGQTLPAGPLCCTILQIPAAAFHPFSSAVTWAYDGNGYVHALTLGSDIYQFRAPVSLPTGTLIMYLDLYYYNNTTSNVVCTEFSKYHGGSALSGPPFDESFTGICSPAIAFAGYGVAESTPQNF